MPRNARRGLTALVALTAALVGCAGRTAPLEPGTSQGTPADLRGQPVMLLPVQDARGIGGDPDAELAFGLTGRGTDVTWILPERLEAVLARAPGLDTRVRGLSVGAFTVSEVRRVGDPLYGELRRLAALVGAEVALIPVRAEAVTAPGSGTAVRFIIAEVHVRTGQVLWFGVVEGEPHPAGDPRGLASAVDRMARTLLWFAAAG